MDIFFQILIRLTTTLLALWLSTRLVVLPKQLCSSNMIYYKVRLKLCITVDYHFCQGRVYSNLSLVRISDSKFRPWLNQRRRKGNLYLNHSVFESTFCRANWEAQILFDNLKVNQRKNSSKGKHIWKNVSKIYTNCQKKKKKKKGGIGKPESPTKRHPIYPRPSFFATVVFVFQLFVYGVFEPDESHKCRGIFRFQL